MKYLIYRRRGPVKQRTPNSDAALLQEKEEEEPEKPEEFNHPLLELQEAYGNRAVSELFAEGTREGVPLVAPDGQAEREADDIAARATETSSEAVVGTDAAADAREMEFEGTAPESVAAVLDSGGHPLDEEVRAELEGAYGESFEDVRVHTGTQAAESTDDVGARAYTVGKHVVFDQGEYAPETAAGKELVAHELTHVTQQGGSTDSVRSGADGRPVLQRQTEETADTGADRAGTRITELRWEARAKSVQVEQQALQAELTGIKARSAIRNNDLEEAKELATRAEKWAEKADEIATRTADLEREYQTLRKGQTGVSGGKTEELENSASGRAHGFAATDIAREAADRAQEAVGTVKDEIRPVENGQEDIEAVEETDTAAAAEDDESVAVATRVPSIERAARTLRQRIRKFDTRLERLGREYRVRIRRDDLDENELRVEFKSRLDQARDRIQAIESETRELRVGGSPD